jgi:quinol monooxygenase YgiN
MAAFNIVRFRVRPGGEQQFIDAHRNARFQAKGFVGGSLVRTGDQTFCMIGEWRSFESLAAARPAMIAILDRVRGVLEDLGGGLGVTDPVSGEVVVRLAGPKPAKKRAAKRKPAKRAARNRKR